MDKKTQNIFLEVQLAPSVIFGALNRHCQRARNHKEYKKIKFRFFLQKLGKLSKLCEFLTQYQIDTDFRPQMA